MDEIKLNLADLENETLAIDAVEHEPTIEEFATGGEGHGMTEIGASCNTCCTGCTGSCQVEELS